MNSEQICVEVVLKIADITKLSCPLPSMEVWNLHPRVYLAPDAENRAICPYCATHYLVEFEAAEYE